MKPFRPLLRTSMAALVACLMMGTISLAQQSSTDENQPSQEDKQSSTDQKDNKDQKDSDKVTPDPDNTSPSAERTQRDARQRQQRQARERQEEARERQEQTREQQEEARERQEEARERQERQTREGQEQARERQNEGRTDDRLQQRRNRQQERDRRRDDRSDRRDDRFDRDRDPADPRIDGRQQDRRREDRDNRFDRRDDRFDREQDQFDRRNDGRRQDQRDEREDRSERRDARSDRDQDDVELGASLRANDQDQLVVSNLSQNGVLVDSGIRQGDVIVSVDNRNISSEAELRRWIRQADRGSRLPLVVMRGGQRRTIYVEPGPRFGRGFDRGFGRGFGRGVDIGVSFRPDPRGRLIVSDLARSGLLVDSGLRPGDVIVQVDDRPIASEVEFTRVLHSYHGPRLPLVVLRDGRRETIYVTIEEDRYASDDVLYSRQAWLGVYLDPQYQDRAVVEAVQIGSPADEAGLRAGDSILRINGERIQGPWHLSRVVGSMQPYEEIDLEVSRRMVRDFRAELAERPERRGRVRYDDDLNLERRSYRGEIQVQPDENFVEYEQ